MMSSARHFIPDDMTIAKYPSLELLKEAHRQLHKHYHDGETGELLDQIETFMRRAKATGAILDVDSDRWVGQSLLDYWVLILYRAKRNPPEAVLDEFDESLAPRLDDTLCPYKGLDAFLEKDRSIFFGRRRLVEETLKVFQEKRLLAVVSPSGSGKSSLVLAGLLPALKSGALAGSENWHFFPPLVPGSDPLKNLALAINPDHEKTADWTQQQTESFKSDYLLKLLTTTTGDCPAVIVIDQFEEIFTLCIDSAARNLFVDNLVEVIQAQGPGHRIILTLRADYEYQIAQFGAFQPLYEESQVRVMPLSAADLREAIQGPASLVGLRFEEGIVDGLIKDVLGEPAGLPLLQFSLLNLWNSRSRNQVTWTAYRSLGGARQALALTADKLYESLLLEDQYTLRRILLRLARPSEGLEVTRNRVRRESLYSSGGAQDRVDRVLGKLVEAGLVHLTEGKTTGDDQVEIAHEALVRNWPRLVDWLDEERISLRQRLRLTAAAESWLEHGRDPGGLIGGSLLSEARRYGDYNELENEFIRASLAAAEESERDKETIIGREPEPLQALVAEQQRQVDEMALAAKRLRRLLMLLTIIYLLTVGTFVLVWTIKADK